MKASDYIAAFLADQGIRDLFLISGGGMMHMLDSVSQQPRLNLVFNLNEQASGICAESYGQFTGHLGACMVTTGPGATNAVTGCAGAWVDGTPVLYISGQCRTHRWVSCGACASTARRKSRLCPWYADYQVRKNRTRRNRFAISS